MPKTHKPRKGSLQFWPRKRAKKILPSVNWAFLGKKAIEVGKKGFLGFICYKAVMLRVLVRDLTPNSPTRNQEIVIPATIVECPPIRIFSIRLYKDNKTDTEIVVSNDRELKRILRVPKNISKDEINKRLEEIEKNITEYDDLRLIVYSLVKKTSIKKTPDIAEVGLAGSIQEKFHLVKDIIGKDINVDTVFQPQQLVDVHGVTKGKGTQGPVKRFGIGLKQHKSEKGVRRPGSLGPWTPRRVSFHAPLAGQLGFFSRVKYNNKVVAIVRPEEIQRKSGFHKYGIVKNTCLIIKGSIQGTQKRPLLITIPVRPSKKTKKQNFEVLKFLK